MAGVEAEQARAAQVQDALYRIAELASAAQDMQEFYRAIHEVVGELMFAPNLFIALWDEERRLNLTQVRVGDYKFDNTNYIGSGFTYGSNYDVDHLPLEDNYDLLRRYLWLSIDRAYKSSVEAIARKRAALKNLSVAEQPDDFAKADPLKRIEAVAPVTFDEEHWKALVRRLSAIFARYPELRNSSVEFSGIHDIRYMATTEGTEVRLQEHVAFVRARASSVERCTAICRSSSITSPCSAAAPRCSAT